MTVEEKCRLAIEKGYTYNPETGLIYNKKNKIIINKYDGYSRFQLHDGNKSYNLRGHQFAWYFIYKQAVNELDHINGIRDDNRICNLRSVNRQQNNWNRVNAKGYHWHKSSNKWAAQIRLNSKAFHLGLYNTEEEARNAYLQAKEKYHKI
jgi:hypothetical protein